MLVGVGVTVGVSVGVDVGVTVGVGVIVGVLVGVGVCTTSDTVTEPSVPVTNGRLTPLGSCAIVLLVRQRVGIR